MTPETPTAVTPLEKLQFHLNITIKEYGDYQKPDLVISEYLTADNYDVHILTNDEKEIVIFLMVLLLLVFLVS